MWNHIVKLNISLAILSSSVALLLQSLPSAKAQHEPVGLSYGSFPYETFSGNFNGSILLTVPSDSIFVVTTSIMASNDSCNLLADGVIVVEGHSQAMMVTNGNYGPAGSALTQGQGHIKLVAGQELSLSSGCGAYFVEGYYAQAG